MYNHLFHDRYYQKINRHTRPKHAIKAIGISFQIGYSFKECLFIQAIFRIFFADNHHCIR